jgi:excisionase family DNA binding protein
MVTSATPRLLTVDEVAERLRVHRGTAYRYLSRAQGALPFVRLGGELGPIRVREDALAAWLQQAQHTDGAA